MDKLRKQSNGRVSPQSNLKRWKCEDLDRHQKYLKLRRKNMFKCKKGRKDEQSPCRKLRKTECSGWQNTIPRIFPQILAENPAEQHNSVGLFGQKLLENPRLCYKYKTYGKCGSKLKFAITPREYKLKLNMWIRTEEKVLFVMRQLLNVWQN